MTHFTASAVPADWQAQANTMIINISDVIMSMAIPFGLQIEVFCN